MRSRYLFNAVLVVLALFAGFPLTVRAQGYVFDSGFPTGSGPGGVAVTASGNLVNSNTLAGSVVLWSGGIPSATRTVWTNPLDGSDTVSLVGGVLTGPRGVAVDSLGRIYTQSNDTDHNLLVWDSSLSPTSWRLRTSIATGNDGRIYAVALDGARRVYVLWYYNVPAGHNRLEVYPPVELWGATHQETPLSSTVIDGSGGGDAHEGMCVSTDGSVVWVSYRGGRSVQRWSGSPTTGYSLDTGFILDLTNGHGFRGLALSGDGSRIFICDDEAGIERIIVANAVTGAILPETFSVLGQGNSSPYAVVEDSSGSLYVAHYEQNVIEKYTRVPLPTELRGMWVSRFEWPSSSETVAKNNITQIMTDLADHNFNAVFFQIRGQMDVLYPSPYEPWSPLLAGLGVDPGWDPLQYAIERAHERGLEFHAYINTHTCWQSASSTPPAHTTPEHPYWLRCDATGNKDWLIHDSAGNPVQFAESDYVWCAPGVPEFCWWIRQVVLHVVTQYNVDGVHFDRIRTPGNIYSYDPISMARMAGRGNPHGLGFHDWTRDQITRMLNDIYAQIMAVKPHVKVSCSPFGIYDRTRFPGYGGFNDGYDKWHQESQRWAQVGVMDAIVPMIYWDIPDPPPNFDILVQDWIDNRFGRHIYAGQAGYKYGFPELGNQITETRTRGGQGNCVFSYSSTPASRFDQYLAGPYAQAAVPPPMPWKDNPTTGIILGIVRDAVTLVPVVDAWVVRSGSSYVWLSSFDGFYGMLYVPPGTYTVSASDPLYGDAQVSGVSVSAGQVVVVDLYLSTNAVHGWQAY